MAPDVRASFRDPSGFVILTPDRVLRVVSGESAGELRALLAAPHVNALIREGVIAATKFIDERGPLAPWSDRIHPDSVVVEHEPIPFPSYPFEWPAEMLYAAAMLTLRIAREVLRDGMELKDATPYNVLFRGPQPVFVDLLSFERHDPHSISWTPYAQYVRTFLLPLLLNRDFQLGIDRLLLSSRDGVEPDQIASMFGWRARLRPLVMKHIVMPSALSRRAEKASEGLYVPRKDTNAAKAAFIFESLLKGLEADTRKVQPDSHRKSEWSDYISADRESTDPYIAAKRDFMREILRDAQAKRVLDVGANTGLFTSMAAEAGASVVAIDTDAVVVGRLWQLASTAKLDILPLVVDLTRPTPGVGWRNSESIPFLERALRFRFDLVAMLGVIHHLCVSERVPLIDVLDLAADMTTRDVVLEFVAADDPMFRRILRGRQALHRDWTQEAFETACGKRFEIMSRRTMPNGTRSIYLLRKKSPIR